MLEKLAVKRLTSPHLKREKRGMVQSPLSVVPTVLSPFLLPLSTDLNRSQHSPHLSPLPYQSTKSTHTCYHMEGA